VAETLGGLPEGTNVHLDRGYDSKATRERLKERGLEAEVSRKGKPAPFWDTDRWVAERTSSWHNAHKKLVWCTERVGRVIDFWVAFSEVVIIVRRLIREAWSRYRWDPHSAPFSGFLSIFFSTRALWMIYLQKRVFDYHECSV
jgi:IS5 family transposase